MSRVLLATTSPAFERLIRSAMADDQEGSLQLLPRGPLPATPSQLVDLVRGGNLPDIVLLGTGISVHEALAFAAQLNNEYPVISIVLVTEPTREVWLQAMRAGVRDVLVPEADEAEIRTVLTRAGASAGVRRRMLARADDPSLVGRVITVASPKGGTGKTTVATNLAVGLAMRAPNTAVLVDLDVQFGDVASALQLTPDHSLVDAVDGAAGQDAMVLKTFLELHGTGLYALCAPDSPAAGDRISGEQVAALLDLLADNFAYVVVDTAPGLGELTLAALDRATDIVQVCGMDVPSVRGLRKELDVLAELDITPLSRSIVLNFADRHGGLSVADVEGTIGTGVDIVLPPSRAVLVSTNHGVPLLQSAARSPVSKELHKLVARHLTPGGPTARDVADASVGAQHAAPAVTPRRWTRRAASSG